MITTKELQYVDAWASKTPMPGIEYSTSVMKDIDDCYKTYNKLYKNKEYNLIFSNGEEISFEILSKNLCHMLGIDYSNLKQDCFSRYRNNVLGCSASDFTSYDLLEMLIENIDKVVEYDNDINNNYKAINYFKSGIKCQIFNKLSNFDKFNFAAINYNPGDGKRDYDREKTLFVPSNEAVCPYFMMGIRLDDTVLDNDENLPKYIVSTLFAPADPKKYFANQEVIIPTQILVSDNNELKRTNATALEKIQLLTMYKSIINMYQLPNRINIYGDYEAMLTEISNGHQKKFIK